MSFYFDTSQVEDHCHPYHPPHPHPHPHPHETILRGLSNPAPTKLFSSTQVKGVDWSIIQPGVSQTGEGFVFDSWVFDEEQFDAGPSGSYPTEFASSIATSLPETSTIA